MRGAADHELSRRALIELYRFRDAIQRARAPAIYPDERKLFEGESQDGPLASEAFYGVVRAYRRRIQAIDDARNPFKASITEAEAIWGTELFELMEDVFKLEREFINYVQLYIGVTNPTESAKRLEDLKGTLARRRDVLMETEEDVYWKDMLGALKKVENYLKTKLVA